MTTIRWVQKRNENRSDTKNCLDLSFNGSWEKRSLQYLQKLRGEWREAKSARWTAVSGNSREAEGDCAYIELGHQLDRVLGREGTQTDQQTAASRLWFKGKSLDSDKSRIDTRASVGGLNCQHQPVQIKTLDVSVILRLHLHYDVFIWEQHFKAKWSPSTWVLDVH